jgi:hypothetical protein
MRDLERELRDIGARLELPPAPDLSAAVLAGLGEPGALRAARPRPRVARTLVVAFAILLVAVGTAFAVPQSRHAILEWLGLEGVTIERVLVLPEAPATASLRLGERGTLAEAQQEVEFPVLVPVAIELPEGAAGPWGVFVDQTVRGGKLSLVYPSTEKTPTIAEGVGMLVTEFRGELEPGLIGKLVPAGAVVEEVTVDGAPGAWIEGAHAFYYRDRDGEVREETLRLAGNVLLFERDGVLVRLESRLTKAEALRVAESFEPAPG